MALQPSKCVSFSCIWCRWTKRENIIVLKYTFFANINLYNIYPKNSNHDCLTFFSLKYQGTQLSVLIHWMMTKQGQARLTVVLVILQITLLNLFCFIVFPQKGSGCTVSQLCNHCLDKSGFSSMHFRSRFIFPHYNLYSHGKTTASRS